MSGILAVAISKAAASAAQGRPANWARPMALDGVPNLHQVAPNIYRSAQPTAAGFSALAKQHGVKTIVSMRAFNSDVGLIRGTELTLAPFPTNTWHIRRRAVVGALRTLRTASRTAPVLLHCQHGADRTGLVMALYRVLYEGWTKEAGLAEMRNGAYGYHAIWGNIPRFIRNVDLAQLREEVGVS
jgi:protein tyrosine/serine phosphatase